MGMRTRTGDADGGRGYAIGETRKAGTRKAGTRDATRCETPDAEGAEFDGAGNNPDWTDS